MRGLQAILINEVENFLIENINENKPLILALSCGVDSICLYHLMLEIKNKFDLHVVHVDHGYRKESLKEALWLKKKVLADNLKFHLHEIERLSIPEKDLENYFREKRYEFFASLAKKLNTDQVLTAHHKDDVIETFIKRLFESHTLRSLKTLPQTISKEGVNYFRPLLSFAKDEIIQWMKNQGHSWHEDSSNQDLRFTRNRIRHQIIPQLESSFGKSIKNCLHDLSQESLAFNRYIESIAKPFLSTRKDYGFALAFSLDKRLDPFIYEQVVGFLLSSCFNALPSHLAKTLVSESNTGNGQAKVSYQNYSFEIESSQLWIVSNYHNMGLEPIKIEEVFQWGQWKIELKDEPVLGGDSTSFIDFGHPRWSLELPLSSTMIVCLPKPNKKWEYKGRKYTLSDWYRTHKVPTPLRKKLPMFFEGKELIADPLTGSFQSLSGPKLFACGAFLEKVSKPS